jgi:hypothetical protein
MPNEESRALESQLFFPMISDTNIGTQHISSCQFLQKGRAGCNSWKIRT